jgi:GAF domain-containing protein
MVSGTGQAGQAMLEAGHKISKGIGLVGRAAGTNSLMLVPDVARDPNWLPHPLLPETKAEVLAPIALGEDVLGVLDVQHNVINGLNQAEADLIQSIANQIAVALRNARLFNKVETALAEAYATQERYTKQSWEKSKIVARRGRHHYTRPNLTALTETERQALIEAKPQALRQNHPTIVPISESNSKTTAVISPVILRNVSIGALQLYPASEDQSWTDDDLAIIEAVSEELAQTAENLRLFEEARERAGYEQTVREITDKLRAAPNLDRLLETAARELGQQLGVRHTVLELGIGLPSSELSSDPEPLSDNGH